ncbi:MAG: hypothetical protein Q8O67_13910 [Deltaproteobacteria bacterium]|nr:hypothetical protein [Deltaproteobacteria bacterium]
MSTSSNQLLTKDPNKDAGQAARRPLFLMSRPRDDWAIRGRANVFAQDAISPAAAAAQHDWDLITAAITEAGGAVVVVDGPDPLLTGLPYTAEAGVLGFDARGPIFVLPRLTPEHRRREPEVIQPALEKLGVRTLQLPEGVRFEGQGDVVDVGPAGAPRFVCTHGEGKWARTRADAFAHYAPLLPGEALHVGFHADPWFHGNTFLGAWRGGTGKGADVVVACCFEALRDDGAARLRAFVEGARIVELSREQTLTYATNALQVNDTVLAPTGVPDVVVDAWRGLGLTVRFLALPALFGKGGGAAVCLTNRLWGFDVDAAAVAAAGMRLIA